MIDPKYQIFALGPDPPVWSIAEQRWFEPGHEASLDDPLAEQITRGCRRSMPKGADSISILGHQPDAGAGQYSDELDQTSRMA